MSVVENDLPEERPEQVSMNCYLILILTALITGAKGCRHNGSNYKDGETWVCFNFHLMYTVLVLYYILKGTLLIMA